MTYSWKRNLFILWLGCFLVSMAYSVSIPFMPIFLQEDLGVTDHLETWTGGVFAITFLASSLIAPFWGSMADKYGRKPMMLRAGICLSASYFMYFIVDDPYMLLIARVVEGLLAGYIPSAIAMIATNTPEKQVGYALGIISTASAAAAIIGPLAGGVISHIIGTRETFFAAGVMVFIAFLIALIWVKEPSFVKPEGKRSSVISDLREAARNRRLMIAIAIVFVTTTSVMIAEPLLTIYVLQLGSSASSASLHAGIIFSAVGVATLLAAPRWGRLGMRIGYEKVLFIGLLGGAIGNVLQVAFHNLLGFGTLRFGYGLFFAAVFPALNAIIAQNTDHAFRSRAFSLNQSANAMGLMAGPLLGGLLGSQLPIPAVFVLTGVFLFGVAMIVRLPRFSVSAPVADTGVGASKELQQ
ncbi:multidrug efflux MFS transporter [Paenibacillus hemerocallicola]|uniref:Multidrug efflux MFS transporter n=1 Tax=Paenibacillus hemerocallicola TaxID=1172614 RepID=A0A5C4SZX1_9BACL|nr:MFS transporter [Paenibacillus hemerocallicola]TNJ62398.1 multidrug efflux MFS transporter [Paenibacillus hemerocallicola]